MTQLYTIHWQSPHGKQITSRALTEAQARAEIENNQRHTPDWTYTVEPPLPDLQAQLDAAHKRIAELEAVCRETIDNFMISYANRVKSGIRVQANWGGYYRANSEDHEDYAFLARLLDTLPSSE